MLLQTQIDDKLYIAYIQYGTPYIAYTLEFDSYIAYTLCSVYYIHSLYYIYI